uniref:Uncharacterized protein n=1 Tax=Triticum urartu TaxID=4572 RepID=A0A8R7U0K6_TRIUA
SPSSRSASARDRDPNPNHLSRTASPPSPALYTSLCPETRVPAPPLPPPAPPSPPPPPPIHLLPSSSPPPGPVAHLRRGSLPRLRPWPTTTSGGCARQLAHDLAHGCGSARARLRLSVRKDTPKNIYAPKFGRSPRISRITRVLNSGNGSWAICSTAWMGEQQCNCSLFLY